MFKKNQKTNEKKKLRKNLRWRISFSLHVVDSFYLQKEECLNCSFKYYFSRLFCTRAIVMSFFLFAFYSLSLLRCNISNFLSNAPLMILFSIRPSQHLHLLGQTMTLNSVKFRCKQYLNCELCAQSKMVMVNIRSQYGYLFLRIHIRIASRDRSLSLLAFLLILCPVQLRHFAHLIHALVVEAKSITRITRAYESASICNEINSHDFH